MTVHDKESSFIFSVFPLLECLLSHPGSLGSAWEGVSKLEWSGDTRYTPEHIVDLKKGDKQVRLEN